VRPGSTRSCDLTQEEIDFLLKVHRDARSEVGVKPLEWSDELAQYAQNWATKIGEAGEFRHSNGPYGENLAEASNAEEAAKSWLSEKGDYRGEAISNDNFGKFGHYTQIVWGDTKRFGAGKYEGERSTLWVCSYDPAGNMTGERPF